MQLHEAIALISHPAIQNAGKSVWADLGCGDGLFSFALAHLLVPGSVIHAADKNKIHLQLQRIPEQTKINTVQFDFVRDELPFSKLDGILMANSLHYVKDKSALINKFQHHLNPSHRFLIVEYDTLRPNQWVPFPVDYKSLQNLFYDAGYETVFKINERQSLFRRENIYAAFIGK